MIKRCWNCNKELIGYNFIIDGKGHKFCGVECKGSHLRKERWKTVMRSEKKWDHKLKGLRT